MSKVYLVTYDLKNNSPRDFVSLFDELKTFPRWCHYLDSSWLIVSEDDANGIFAKLKPHLHDKVNLLVIEVGKDRQGWMPQKAWDWIKKNMGSKKT